MTMTEKQAEAFAEFVTDIQGGDAEDVIDFTATTLDEMGSFGQWHEVGGVNDQGDDYEYKAIHYTGVQEAPGNPRKDVFVMDFGIFRAAYSI